MTKAIDFTNGLTVKELKGIIQDWSEENQDGEPCEVWIETGKNLSSPVMRILPLNQRKKDDGEYCSDMLLSSNAFRVMRAF